MFAEVTISKVYQSMWLEIVVSSDGTLSTKRIRYGYRTRIRDKDPRQSRHSCCDKSVTTQHFGANATYLGKMPSLFPTLPVHQSVSLSVLFRIVMISPFLKPRSPGWSASKVNLAIAWSDCSPAFF